MRDAAVAGKPAGTGTAEDPIMHPMDTPPTVDSPCVGVCAIDETSGHCAGCARTIDEIVAWGRADVATKRRVLALARERRERRDASCDAPPGTRADAP